MSVAWAECRHLVVLVQERRNTPTASPYRAYQQVCQQCRKVLTEWCVHEPWPLSTAHR